MSLRGLLGARLVDVNGKPNGLMMVTDKEGGVEFTAEDETILSQQWTVEHYKAAENGQLLQDDENPRRLISFGPWKDAQSVQGWRSSKEFVEFMKTARELCDEIKPSSLHLVAEQNQED